MVSKGFPRAQRDAIQTGCIADVTWVVAVSGVGAIAVDKKTIFLWTDGFSIFVASDPTKLVPRGTKDGVNVGPMVANGAGCVFGEYDNASAIIDAHDLDAPKYASLSNQGDELDRENIRIL